MFIYLKFLEKFLTSVLLSKDEYNINSKHFNPVRVVVTTFLVLNFVFTFYLVTEMANIHDEIAVSCPGVLEKVKKNKELEDD